MKTSKTPRKFRRPIAEMNVVPYIDVMLVLLVIFMVTAPLLSQGINVQLPRTQARSLDPKAALPIIVSIDAHGQLFLNDNPTPTQPLNAQKMATRVAALLSIAKEQAKPRQVYVKADSRVSFGVIASTMALLQRAGTPQVGLITQPDNNAA